MDSLNETLILAGICTNDGPLHSPRLKMAGNLNPQSRARVLPGPGKKYPGVTPWERLCYFRMPTTDSPDMSGESIVGSRK